MGVGGRGAARAKNCACLVRAARGAGVFRAQGVGAQCVERIVGDEAAPDEAPQRVDGFAGIAAADGLVQRVEEAGAGGFENGEEFFFALGEWLAMRSLLGQQGQLVGKVEGDAAVAFADGLNAGPGHFAGGDECVETGWIVAGNARGQDGRLEQRGGNGRALQVFDGVEQRVEMGRTAAARREQPLPVREKARERVLLHRLDFAAEPGEGLAADLAKDFRIAPLAMKTAGTEAAFEDAAFCGEQSAEHFRRPWGRARSGRRLRAA